MKSGSKLALVLGAAALLLPALGTAQVVQQREGTPSRPGATSNIPEVERNPGNAVGATRDGTGGNPQPSGAQGGSPRPPAAQTAPSQGGGAAERGRSASGGRAPTR